ncbi:hypothetical protein Btru_059240 [Bulinus truncatus]|nr:hypothetical protein Btru_059240 [Bulinus truncatus]
MRSVRHYKIITAQVDYLESILTQLHSLTDHTRKVINKGKIWLDDGTEMNVAFPEMTLAMENEISSVLSKCLEIANSSDNSHIVCGKSFLSREVINPGNEPITVDAMNSNETTALLRIKLEDLEATVSSLQLGIHQQKDETRHTNIRMEQIITNTDCTNKENESFKTQILQKLSEMEDWMKSDCKNTEVRVNIDEIERFQKEHYLLRDNVSDLETKVNELSHKVDNADNENLVVRVTATEETSGKMSSLIEKINDKFENSDNQQITQKLNSAILNISQLQTTCSELPLSLQKRLDSYDKQIKISNVLLLRRLTSLKEVFHRDISFKKMNAASASEQLAEIKVTTTSLKFDVSVLQGRLQNVSDKLKSFVESTDSKVDNLTHRVDSMICQVSKVESSLQENRRKFDSNIEHLQSRFSGIECDLDEMRTSLAMNVVKMSTAALAAIIHLVVTACPMQSKKTCAVDPCFLRFSPRERDGNIHLDERVTFLPHSQDVRSSVLPHSQDVRSSVLPHSQDVRSSVLPHAQDVRSSVLPHSQDVRSSVLPHSQDVRSSVLPHSQDVRSSVLPHSQDVRSSVLPHYQDVKSSVLPHSQDVRSSVLPHTINNSIIKDG